MGYFLLFYGVGMGGTWVCSRFLKGGAECIGYELYLLGLEYAVGEVVVGFVQAE